MSGERKTYFLAPTRDSPPGGPIVLGSIIASPQQAEMPITAALPIDPSVLGAGGDVGFSHIVSDTRSYQFDRLETQAFWPTEEYVEAGVTAKPVQDFLKSKKFFHNVYMITSIKIAYGASAARSAMQNRGVYVHLGVDGTTAGIPISGGPQGDLGWGTTKSSSSERESGFVFAFRLREICYATRRGLRQSEFVKGALFGLDSSTSNEGPARGQADDDHEATQEFELMGLADENVHAEDVDENAKEIEEDGETCECVVLSDSV
ncbi:MAG: hypothetical protein Q9166_002862 [cf. Caloplaca sp. 2 TL-2023]